MDLEHPRETGFDTTAHLTVEKRVIGANVGADGYTTLDQAAELARLLSLGPEDHLLDVGAGRGWPALFLVQTSGCRAALLDVSDAGLRQSVRRADTRQLTSRCAYVRGAATALPFRSRVFDALVHSDVL